jgi:hypothetical protein
MKISRKARRPIGYWDRIINSGRRVHSQGTAYNRRLSTFRSFQSARDSREGA